MQKGFFLYLTFAMLALSIWGFSDNLIWDVGQPSNSDPKFVVHGLFFLSWMIILVVQANFIRTKNYRLHQTVGTGASVVLIGLVVSTVYVFAAIWNGWENMEPFVKANRILFASFVILISAALFVRHRAHESHKRLMVVGTLFVMEPMLSRVYGTFEITVLRTLTDPQLDFYWYVMVFGLWIALFASLFVNDWMQFRRIHPVTLGGIVWLVSVWTAVHFI